MLTFWVACLEKVDVANVKLLQHVAKLPIRVAEEESVSASTSAFLGDCSKDADASLSVKSK
jgi:hypothetical protein